MINAFMILKNQMQNLFIWLCFYFTQQVQGIFEYVQHLEPKCFLAWS